MMNWKTWLAICAGIIAVPITATWLESDEVDQMMADANAREEQQDLSRGWTYDEQHDEMRNITTKGASVRAEGLGDMAPVLRVFQVDGDGYIVIRGSLDNRAAPTLLCVDGNLTVKFDDGPLRTAWCKMVGLEIGIDPKLYSRLKTSNVMQIEVETDHLKREQFKFNTGNLTL